MKYRKKPVVVEAMQFVKQRPTSFDLARTNWAHIVNWVGDAALPRPPDAVGIKTLEGTHWASVGDWIIKGIQGEFYPCKPDIFEATYEPVDESDPVGNIGLSGHLRVTELFPPRAK